MKFHITFIVVSLFLPVFSSYGQLEITGKVFDREDVICGVTIREKGTNNGTISDIEGNFSLQVTDSNSIIEFLYIGYKPKEVTIGKKRDLLITLKEDCNIDFFDEKEIWLGLSSDLVNNPFGGFFQITHPFIKSTLIGSVGYQSDFSDNHKFDAKFGLIHLLVDCDYNADLDFNYKNLKNKDEFQFRNYIIESKINFSRPKIFPNYTTLYLGFGLSDVNKPDFSQTNQAGYMLGIGTGMNIRFLDWTFLGISAKTVYWTNFWEWKGEIVCKIKHIVLSAEFDIIDSSFMSSIKIGYRFGYWRIPSHVKQNINK